MKNNKLTFEQECLLIANGEDLPQEKQIEEMTKDLKENLRLCAGVKLLGHQVETIAYELLKKYQPKLPKDSVILSKEEWDKLMGDTYTSKEVDEIVAYKERVKTREVSRDILTKLACDFRGLDGMDVEYPLNKVNELAKQCGVEIKED